MSTELTTLKSENFLALAEGSDLAEAMSANMIGGGGITAQDLIRVKTPTGGSTVWRFEDITGDVEAKELTGIFVFWAAGGVLWPTENPSGASPVLVTKDLKTARRVGDDYGDLDPDVLDSFQNPDGTYDWHRLCVAKGAPYGFGSGKNGGKRADEYRTIGLLRPEDTLPIMVTVKGGSFKSMLPFVTRLPVAHYRCIISLGLEKTTNNNGQEFSRIQPKLVGQLTKEQGETVKEMFTEPLNQSL